MDRLTSMAVFVAAVEEGSLSRAARRFGLSASMAGKHVTAIEEDLGVRLMQRSTRALTLTDAGRSYYIRCERILQEYEDANREAMDTQQSVQGVLRIAAPQTFGAMHLSGIVAAYLARYPDVTVETVLSDRYVDLLAEGVDLAIRIGRLPDSDLVVRYLAPCRMVLCAAPAFLQRHGTPSTVEDARHAPRLTFNNAVSPGDWTIITPEGDRQVIDGPIRLAANDMQMLLAAALAGTGIAYGPSFVFEKHIAAGRLVTLLPDHTTSELAIQAVYPTKRHVSLKLRRFLDLLVDSFGESPPWDGPPSGATVGGA
ncbi:LysR family transcriptional regulator [Nitrospirillum sp. BR 11828]|uniref:LysR family transcriptional regulator n=1 Tax=Nitrospirillum sp. BR 11828 TaxID=3104325 RepID=UPI002ACA308D|nr:LysR family transcriptional regulator [Nitrospirillum sp. BR 11828]MDZ5648507.1 LysR family transcriptional regulator [Nitrospirillum sp. BR 11828]